ncbi:radical SAM protein [Nonomuraea turcica]|uniref:radical SAM protein n=1 Tax=Nonomuraea sp. G32 TaxID=3067274 RepID=UPI00273BEA97|nr:radical SAM protein [Nonomuraea sp. G32]MDP4512124.1 radical SAM protein [Nonomuraea sp. G32]
MEATVSATQAAATAGPTAFHVMAKPVGALCNLDCEYCYFLSKEQLYPGRRAHMSKDVHEAWIRQLLQGHGDGEVVVAFQGGEPTLMGLDFFRRTIELEREFARPGQQVLNTLQTNGTLLDDTWGEFLAEHDFLVGISIDGPRELHDAYRVDKGGKPTFERVMRGLDVLRRHRVEWNALTTVHAANAEHGRAVYTFLRDDCGATFTQFIPIVERTAPELLLPVQALVDEHEEFNRSLSAAAAAAGLLPYIGVALEALLRNMLEESEDLHGRTCLAADGQIVIARSNAATELAIIQRAEAVRRMLA